MIRLPSGFTLFPYTTLFRSVHTHAHHSFHVGVGGGDAWRDRKSTRLNSSHRCSSYAVFCLKKKTYDCAPLRLFREASLLAGTSHTSTRLRAEGLAHSAVSDP